MSLAILARAGLPVPDGFYITTAAYKEFVAASGLQAHILTALETVDAAHPATFETASRTITGLFTVLVEGGDHDEPVADAVRGILDGHIVLERAIAERGRYPAVNILRSASRTMPGCNSEEENALVGRARQLIARYEDMAEMIRLGAYQAGADPGTDEAIRYHDRLEQFLSQRQDERTDLASGYQILERILKGEAL